MAQDLDVVADRILATQLSIAWAGEALCQPKRLGWWKTDLIDRDGGGDFLERLLPRTYEWAGLELAREAARRQDEQARLKMANRDNVRTLFHLGFEWDERLTERLRHHKASGKSPTEALPTLHSQSVFDQAALTQWITGLGGNGANKIAPGGRELKGKAPESPDALVHNLAAALIPFAADYPLPFYRVAQ